MACSAEELIVHMDLLPSHIRYYHCIRPDNVPEYTVHYSGERGVMMGYASKTELQTRNRYFGCNIRGSGDQLFIISRDAYDYPDGGGHLDAQTIETYVNVNPVRWFSNEYTNINLSNESVPPGTVIGTLAYFGTDTSATRSVSHVRYASDADVHDWDIAFSVDDNINQLIAHSGLNGYETSVIKHNVGIRGANTDEWDTTYVTITIPRDVPLNTSLVPLPHVNMHDIVASVSDLTPVDTLIGTITFDTRGSDEHFSISSTKFRIEGLSVFLNESLAFGEYIINETITLTTSSVVITCDLTVNVLESSAPDLSGWTLTDDTINNAGDSRIILLTDNLVYTPATQVFSHDTNLVHWSGHYVPQPLGPEIPIVEAGSYEYNFLDASLIADGETFSITVENAKGSDTKDFILHKEKDTANMLSGYPDYMLDHPVSAGDTIFTLSIVSPYAGNITVATTTNTRVAIGLDGAVTALEDITMNCEESLVFNVHLETADKQHNSSFDIYNVVNEPICDPALLYINEGLPEGTVIGSIADFVTDTNGCTDIVYELAESGQPYNPRWVSPAWINDIISLNHDTGEIVSRVVFDFSVENQYDFAVFVNNSAENGAGWCDVSISINEV